MHSLQLNCGLQTNIDQINNLHLWTTSKSIERKDVLDGMQNEVRLRIYAQYEIGHLDIYI